MKKFYYQVYYWEQDGDKNDTIEIVVPTTVTEDDIIKEVKNADWDIEPEDDVSRLDRTDKIFNQVASELRGTWRYLPVVDVLVVR